MSIAGIKGEPEKLPHVQTLICTRRAERKGTVLWALRGKPRDPGRLAPRMLQGKGQQGSVAGGRAESETGLFEQLGEADGLQIAELRPDNLQADGEAVGA